MLSVVSCEDRLKAMIISDKQGTPQKINKLLKAEILFVLKNYFDITSEDLAFDIIVDSFGKYEINVVGKARGIKVDKVF